MNATASSAAPLRIALLGNPNCGKTALFNLLTGSRQKVANYAGVTVERKEGTLTTPQGRQVMVLDLPGAYSLTAMSADEAVTRDIITGQRPQDPLPDLIVCVVDATNLKLNLRLVLEARDLGLPMVLALNMTDLARRSGIEVDRERLARELGMPVVDTVGVQHDGARALLERLDDLPPLASQPEGERWQAGTVEQVMATQQAVRRIVAQAVRQPPDTLARDDAIDRVVLHPLWGMLLLAFTLFLMFQAVFSWAAWPMELIKSGVQLLSDGLQAALPAGPLVSLLTDGVIAGAGSVLVFLPQILVLFFFILVLEDSGYLPRAAFLLDRVMGTVGLSGRSFIPLLSSFACAVPGVMATRTITHWRDRLVTIMIAPLMTCSARPRAAHPAHHGAPHLPAARRSQPGARALRARSGLRAAGWRHPAGDDDPAVVPLVLSRRARRCHRPGHPVQPGGHHWPLAGAPGGADRLQLADRHRAGSWHGRARGGGGCAGHGVRALGHR
jgi:ferrous iron transport protein B